MSMYGNRNHIVQYCRANYFWNGNVFGMMHFISVVQSMFWNMSPLGGTYVAYLHPPTLNEGQSKQGRCFGISVSKFLPFQDG